jgi:hypothetical protein
MDDDVSSAINPKLYVCLVELGQIPTYTGNQVFDSVDKLVNYIIVERYVPFSFCESARCVL